MRQLALTLPALLALAGAPMGWAFAQTPLDQPQPRPENPPAPPPPQPPAEAAPVSDGPNYDITSIQLRYATEHPDRPPIETFLRLEVPLSVVDGVLVAPRAGVEQVTIRLEDLTSNARGSRKFAVSGINAIGGAIVRELNAQGLIGVLVAPDPNQIDPESLADKRPASNRSLTLDIWTRTVSQIRTLGSGPRWARETAPGDKPSQETRVNSRYHERIRDNSPLQPGVGGEPGDLLRKDTLDDYLFRLNRHPGRRVDAAIASGDEPGQVVLDYIVTENKPWTVYLQASNTGTAQTNEWRERLGFVHTQLMNRDDTLTLDYITAGFDDANALSASYDAPFAASEKLRFKLMASGSTFKASDVGLASETFEGDSFTFGGELDLNVWQRRQSFVDLFGGVRFTRQHVEETSAFFNQVINSGQTEFFIPYVGARFERSTEKASGSAEVRLEHNVPDVSTDADQIDSLGRLGADEDWTVVKWDLSTAFYLEPLLFGDWADPNAKYRHTTLAHEVALAFRGQYAFDSRLIPQEQGVIGGLYSVRGYDESAVAGDNSVLFSAEYRWHIPRWLTIREPGGFMGKPFRWAPDQRYGRPDWDLVLKGFTDAGRVTNNDRVSYERDSTLWSAGVGAELLFKRNISLRVDWGVALHDAGRSESGDNKFHIVATILY